MARYSTSVTTPAGVKDVFVYLADFSNIIDWDPSVTEAGLLAGKPGAVASRYRVVVGLPLRSIVLEYELLEAQRPTRTVGGRLVLRAENSDVVSLDTITIEPQLHGGAVVVYDALLTPKGIRRLFDPAFTLVMQVIGRRARGGLEEAVRQLPTAPA